MVYPEHQRYNPWVQESLSPRPFRSKGQYPYSTSNFLLQGNQPVCVTRNANAMRESIATLQWCAILAQPNEVSCRSSGIHKLCVNVGPKSFSSHSLQSLCWLGCQKTSIKLHQCTVFANHHFSTSICAAIDTPDLKMQEHDSTSS